MHNELIDATTALAIFELWLDGEIDHNIAVPYMFNIPKMEEFQAYNYSSEFLEAFEDAVEYETVRSLMDTDTVKSTAEKIIHGFKISILKLIKE